MQKYVIALYIRLSLEDYKYDSMSIENQHLALNEFVSSMPESTHAEVLEFIDNGYSGTNFERPKVQELIEMVRANKIDCIIVKDFSRFALRLAISLSVCSLCFTLGSFLSTMILTAISTRAIPAVWMWLSSI